MNSSAKQGMELVLDWGLEPDGDKSVEVSHDGDAVTVRMHPGLSRSQVEFVANDLGEHGPAFVEAWEKQTGF